MPVKFQRQLLFDILTSKIPKYKPKRPGNTKEIIESTSTSTYCTNCVRADYWDCQRQERPREEHVLLRKAQKTLSSEQVQQILRNKLTYASCGIMLAALLPFYFCFQIFLTLNVFPPILPPLSNPPC